MGKDEVAEREKGSAPKSNDTALCGIAEVCTLASAPCTYSFAFLLLHNDFLLYCRYIACCLAIHCRRFQRRPCFQRCDVLCTHGRPHIGANGVS